MIYCDLKLQVPVDHQFANLKFSFKDILDSFDRFHFLD